MLNFLIWLKPQTKKKKEEKKRKKKKNPQTILISKHAATDLCG